MMRGERKLWEIRSTPKPAKPKGVLTTVSVRGVNGQDYYCYINFSEKFEEFVGKKMPRGVSENDPAWLHVTCHALSGGATIAAHYLSDKSGCELWHATKTPTWLKMYKVKHDGTQG
jgi:hypothetical protein